jgi:7-cyano-7-deazaguanine synthase
MVELHAAARVAKALGAASHRTVNLDLRALGGSALTGDVTVPKGRSAEQMAHGVPSTYVPARNTVMLGLALGLAEVMGASDLFLGVHAVDYSGYPDCRPAFIDAFEQLANVATAAATEQGIQYRIHTPLIHLSKAEIIVLGTQLGVDYSITRSCYDPLGENGLACGQCDSCQLRAAGFRAAGIPDPTPYAKHQAG